MLGHLRPSTCSLDQSTRASYQNFYCSICASLRSQYSLPFSLFINNELTLVLLAFEEDMETREEGKTRCPAAGFTITQERSKHTAIDLAAQLSVLLGWVKVVDWQTDKPALYKKAIQKSLEGKVNGILPMVDETFQKVLDDYLILTKEDSTDFEQVNQLTGQLSEQVAYQIGLKTSASIEKVILVAQLFEKCGRLISVADHLIDVEKDQLAKQYNPILHASFGQGTSLAEEYFKLLWQFNRLVTEIQQLLKSYLKFNYIHQAFYTAMRKTLTRMRQEVQQARPTVIERDMKAEDFQLEAADCGVGMTGVECDCAESSTYFDQQANQCCCKGGQCPCDKCCHGGGSGGCCKNGCPCSGGSGGGCCKNGCPCDNCSGCNCCKGGCPCDNCKGPSCHCDCCDTCKGCGSCGDGNRGNCNCCDCGDCCCDTCCRSSSENSEEQKQLMEEYLKADSLKQVQRIEDFKQGLEQINLLKPEQLEEINHLADSVAEQDSRKIRRMLRMVEVYKDMAGDTTKTIPSGDQVYQTLKTVIEN